MKKVLGLTALIVIALAGFAIAVGPTTAVAWVTTTTHEPPGQGECEHGNAQKPCKDDPQPEHGKDCEEHGPYEGGVNEDHCKGTTTTTTTTGTTTTTTTGTTTTTTTGTTTTGTTTTNTTTQTTTTNPPCRENCNPCPPGQHQGGKDGEPGNDATCVPDNPPCIDCQSTTTTTAPPPTTTEPPPTTTTVPPVTTTETTTPSAPKPPSHKPQKPKPPKKHHHKPPPMPPVCSPAGVETTPCAVPGQG